MIFLPELFIRHSGQSTLEVKTSGETTKAGVGGLIYDKANNPDFPQDAGWVKIPKGAHCERPHCPGKTFPTWNEDFNNK